MPYNCEECNVIGAKLNNLVEKRLCRDCLKSDNYILICKSMVKSKYNYNNNDFENYPYSVIYTNNPFYKSASGMNLFYEKDIKKYFIEKHNYEHYLKPGSILFWKYKKPDFIYGHVALVLDSNNKITTIIQQNLNPPVKIYDTKTLFEKMNDPKSKFLGIKTIPKKLAKNIEIVDYNIIRLQNNQLDNGSYILS